MPYSSNLTDSEWLILEPLLLQILHKKQTRLSLSEVSATHEAQDSGKLVGKAIVEII